MNIIYHKLLFFCFQMINPPFYCKLFSEYILQNILYFYQGNIGVLWYRGSWRLFLCICLQVFKLVGCNTYLCMCSKIMLLKIPGGHPSGSQQRGLYVRSVRFHKLNDRTSPSHDISEYILQMEMTSILQFCKSIFTLIILLLLLLYFFTIILSVNILIVEKLLVKISN